MSQAHTFDASIPVLTEVLKAEPLRDELLPGETPQEARTAMRVSKRSEQAAHLEAAAVEQWGQEEWAALEHRLAERILHQLHSRVDFVLEQRIKDSMAEVLTHALQGLTQEIRVGLHDTLEKIVARAVSQELTHLQAQKK
ncbi:hypothetical protein ACLB1G_13380 [Oxalobacteraceae bacterium A2-2]